ncbi:DUF3618 domain-containing protein [Dactylosporangium aurantiacum]|uniref:DUF3618 domain-containing protein n=1 Tax=Dactylosporangium aurantiacum TaxID=35754 RepID=A0A9Q9ML04_9ACTN|nr:DUF3618 domain-containing protein [Dactylosporangium aurantiacum]MDG6109743.1 DUF3618 domain-containing protein [Dactylosporangium aurantiacum]UWZ56321.1 DUF3618 domain-containing protein [Dactylosporangium aurantiacum]
MTATESKNSHNGHVTPTDPEALRQEIARTRAGLGETVEALAAKADVKARAQEAVSTSVTAAKLRMREGVEQVAVNAAYAGRELRTHPRQVLDQSLRRMVRSARERPAPWVVASGLLILMALIGYRKGQE